MKLIKSISLASILLLVAVTPVLADVDQLHDTNGDGTNDFRIIKTDTQVHFDTNKNGVQDAGETVINCARVESFIKAQHANGGLIVRIKCNTGTEVTTSTHHVRDNNGDGDTNDKGEVAP